MGPSSDFRQGRLPFGITRTPEHRDARTMVSKELRGIEDMRARFIDQICDQYREGGSEIRLVRPDRGPQDLHLFVNGKCAGVFVEQKMGLVFRQANGEAKQ